MQSVIVCFWRAGGDRQSGEGPGPFDPLHFSLHVYIDVIYFLMLTQQTAEQAASRKQLLIPQTQI